MIKTAFRKRLMESHPDVAPTDMIGWGVLAHDGDVQEIVWARDVLFRKVTEAVTDSNGDSGLSIPTRNESRATIREWRGAVPPDSRHTYNLAEQIAKELRNRPADS